MGELSLHARAIWDSGVDAVRAEPLTQRSLADANDATIAILRSAPRLIVVGAGKAGTAMATGVEAAFADRLNRIEGVINVPEGTERSLQRIRLHPARPAGVNEPTAAGVQGAEEMRKLVASAGPEDAVICVLSGGGSALLPLPVEGVSLADKLALTKLLHRSGATIHEMNSVRKHLSNIKGGRLAEAFTGRVMLGLMISDVVGDPLDVIASGPTAADPTTFADALAVLDRHGLRGRTPTAILEHLERGLRGEIRDTPKAVPPRLVNRIVGSNAVALSAAEARASTLGYRVLNLGSFIEGETREVATAIAGVVRSIRETGLPIAPPACILLGGETTVTLGDNPGRGGRNQEFALAMLAKLGPEGMRGVTVLSGGTDGEDGPTDAAGGLVDETTYEAIATTGRSIEEHLRRHDAYPLLDAVNGLVRTGLTQTNVMDVRVILIR